MLPYGPSLLYVFHPGQEDRHIYNKYMIIHPNKKIAKSEWNVQHLLFNDRHHVFIGEEQTPVPLILHLHIAKT